MDGSLKKPTVLLWTDSPITSGHITASSRLARALQEQGCDVTIVTSEAARGLLDDASGLTIKTIPTAQFLYEGDSLAVKQPLGGDAEELHAQRLEAMKQVVSDMEPKPDVFVSEFWPLGFRYFEDEELLPLMDFMKQENPDLKSYAFLRDYNMLNQVPENSAEGRVKLLNDKFDLALFRGDEKLLPLGLSFEGEERNITIPHRHVGYMINPEAVQKDNQESMVVVAAGGSNYPHTDAFLKQALKARQHSKELSSTPWRVYVSKSTPAELMDELKDIAAHEPDGDAIDIRPTDDTFLSTLKNSKFALLRGGASAIESAAMQVPTVIFPNGKGRDEQVLRSTALANHFPYVEMVDVEDLQSTKRFAEVMDSTYTPHANKSAKQLKTGGAENAARNIVEHFNDLPLTQSYGRSVA